MPNKPLRLSIYTVQILDISSFLSIPLSYTHIETNPHEALLSFRFPFHLEAQTHQLYLPHPVNNPSIHIIYYLLPTLSKTLLRLLQKLSLSSLTPVPLSP